MNILFTLALCLAAVTIVAAYLPEECMSYTDSQVRSGCGCAGKKKARDPHTGTVYCCRYDFLLPVFDRQIQEELGQHSPTNPLDLSKCHCYTEDHWCYIFKCPGYHPGH